MPSFQRVSQRPLFSLLTEVSSEVCFIIEYIAKAKLAQEQSPCVGAARFRVVAEADLLSTKHGDGAQVVE